MAHRFLSRDGRDSNRNLARRYRPPRIVIKDGVQQFHELDMMRLGVPRKDGTVPLVNTTGCFGVVNPVGRGRVAMYVTKGMPGKVRGPKKTKRVCKLYHKNTIFDFSKASFEQLRNLRKTLLTIKIIGDIKKTPLLSPGLSLILDQITEFLMERYPEKAEELKMSDHERENSVSGMVRSPKFKFQGVKSLDQRIKRALAIMRAT